MSDLGRLIPSIFMPAAWLLATMMVASPRASVGAAEVEPLAVTRVAVRREPSAFVFGSEAFLIGGEISGRAVSSAERYLPFSEDASAAIDLELVVPRKGAAPVVTPDGVFILGGQADGGQDLASIEWVRSENGRLEGPMQIEPGTGLNLPRHGHSAVQIGSWIYVVGGQGPDGMLVGTERAPLTAEGNLGRFDEFATASLRIPRMDAMAIRLGGHLYVGGGASAAGMPLDSWERAPIGSDGDLGAFEPVEGIRLESPRRAASVLEHEGCLLVFGGTGQTGDGLRSIEVSTWSVEVGLSPFRAGPDLARPRTRPLLWPDREFVRVITGDAVSESLEWERLHAASVSPVPTPSEIEAAATASLDVVPIPSGSLPEPEFEPAAQR